MILGKLTLPNLLSSLIRPYLFVIALKYDSTLGVAEPNKVFAL